MKFIIDRAKWKNKDHGEGPTRLLNNVGFMCCLGQVGEQLGVPNLLNQGTPYWCQGAFVDVGLCTKDTNTPFANTAVRINDGRYSDVAREEALIALFKEHGHELEFKGEFTC